jgi:hypothetical protein
MPHRGRVSFGRLVSLFFSRGRVEQRRSQRDIECVLEAGDIADDKKIESIVW